MDIVQAVACYNYSRLVMELESYHALYAPYLRAGSQRSDAYHYLAGLLDPSSERKSAENIALARAGSERVRPLEYFLGESRWSDAPLLVEHRRQIGFTLGDGNGVLILDGSDCAKQGEHSVGVVRQWCGETAQLPTSAWQPHARKEGAKGLIVAKIALCRVVAMREGLPGPHLWLLLRRSTTDPADLHYFLS
jgi:hypothetical protein